MRFDGDVLDYLVARLAQKPEGESIGKKVKSSPAGSFSEADPQPEVQRGSDFALGLNEKSSPEFWSHYSRSKGLEPDEVGVVPGCRWIPRPMLLVALFSRAYGMRSHYWHPALSHSECGETLVATFQANLWINRLRLLQDVCSRNRITRKAETMMSA
ncbi:predicted protein [Uncinocarpus reesii 1704]|uniref:Uncharacterized protein n=1 Tax=Uncinocarpus reesii (strain UAMH 1704) TaxID=336963 RepID=C4JFZ7_UNCRE|nr:uncharacterized protein UREG_01077 [Uncinocarpus reesii 1704]EEP76228.1 predicted protein [Uncinocarpus reesii 1704]